MRRLKAKGRLDMKTDIRVRSKANAKAVMKEERSTSPACVQTRQAKYRHAGNADRHSQSGLG